MIFNYNTKNQPMIVILILSIQMTLSIIPGTFEQTTTVDGVAIGWIQIFSCPEGWVGSTQTFVNNVINGDTTGADYFKYFQHAIAAQILPSGTNPSNYNFNDPTDSYAVMTRICSIPVVALNNNLDLSWPIDPHTRTSSGNVADATYINNNYLGSLNARARLIQTCTTPQGPNPIYFAGASDNDYNIYWACGNTEGLHVTQSQCNFDYRDTSAPDVYGVSFWLGFDQNKMGCCVVEQGSDPHLGCCE
eukprot:172027_1